MRNPKKQIVEVINVDYSKSYNHSPIIDALPVSMAPYVLSYPVDPAYCYSVVFNTYYSGLQLNDLGVYSKIAQLELLKFSNVYLEIVCDTSYFSQFIPINNYSSRDRKIIVDPKASNIEFTFNDLVRADNNELNQLINLYFNFQVILTAYPKTYYYFEDSSNTDL